MFLIPQGYISFPYTCSFLYGFTQDPCEAGAYGMYGQFDSYINPNDFTSKVTPT